MAWLDAGVRSGVEWSGVEVRDKIKYDGEEDLSRYLDLTVEIILFYNFSFSPLQDDHNFYNTSPYFTSLPLQPFDPLIVLKL